MFLAQIPDTEYSHPVVFLDHRHNAPLCHPSHIPRRTHILSLPGPKSSYEQVTAQKDYVNVPYALATSIVSWEPTLSKHSTLTKEMMCDLLRERPDLVGAYALSLCPSGYKTNWADAVGCQVSSLSPWNVTDLSPLFAYVYSLYIPLADHDSKDHSIHSPAVSNPIGRRTRIWVSSSDDDFAVIKDTFRREDELLKEPKMLQAIHSDGLVPGVVSIVSSNGVTAADASRPVQTTSRTNDNLSSHRCRVKERMVMGSKGVRFEKAKSVKDLLKSTYDVLEVHRWLGKHRRIIHRDMSKSNVLMYPELNLAMWSIANIFDPPIMIDDILGGFCSSYGVPQCLLIDFDHSTSKSPLLQRTGTPIFIARAVNRTTLMKDSWSLNYHKMPELSGNAKDIYENAYGAKMYSSFCDTDGTTHGGVAPGDLPLHDIPTMHRMGHYAESVFCLLLTTLLRQVFANHEITEMPFIDSRQTIFLQTPTSFERMLHPGLGFLDPMLYEMMLQVRPEYGYLRRVLLKYLSAMEDDVLLDVGNLRSVEDPRRVKKSVLAARWGVLEEPECDCRLR
ncbi:hypothetical protein C8Q75DRAFT_888614 [Abortiporus biennis]|nr:hypothetical protein C8Q75DRAFT_888614 [Abortiporus biennis]